VISVAERVQSGRAVVRSEVVSAVHAIEVGDAHAAIAVPACCGNLIGALRAEVVFALHPRTAGWAERNDRLAQQEIEDGANASWHDQADDDPDARAHAAAWRIIADVAHHEHVKRSEKAPSDRQIEADAYWRVMMALMGKDYPEEILHSHKSENRRGNRPTRNQPQFIGE